MNIYCPRLGSCPHEPVLGG